MKITIPLTPPSVNTYVRHTKRGGHYLTPQAEAFKDAVALFSRMQDCVAEPHKRISVALAFHFKNRRCPDIDNLPKLVLDGLQAGGVLANDNQVDNLRVSRHFGGEEKTEITIEALNG